MTHDFPTLLNGCWLNLYKPKGLSSNQALGKVKRLLGVKKMGHGGTLDPLAEGVLPIAIDECTKLVSHLLMADKTYEFDIVFGQSRTTDDCEGDVLERSDTIPTTQSIQNIIPSFLGPQEQVPPLYSALKVHGKRLCDHVREETFTPNMRPAARSITIYSLTFIQWMDDTTARFCVHCTKGTYVRSLARDLSKTLGSVGHVGFLKRTQSGYFRQENAIFLENLSNPTYNKEALHGFLPCAQPLDDILVLCVNDQEALRLRHGQSVSYKSSAHPPLTVLLQQGSWLLGVGTLEEDTLFPKRLFNKNVYRL